MALEGAKIVEAFDREFAFVAVQGLGGRESLLLTGTAEIKESAERAAVFAVLDATNRWTELRRPTLARRWRFVPTRAEGAKRGRGTRVFKKDSGD